MIYAVLSFAALLVWVAFAAYRQGKKAEKGEKDAETLDDVHQAKIIRDNLNDPIEFERVRNRFER